MTWTADDIPDLRGRTAVVTGANSGLGLVTATELARHGAHVIMAVRDTAAGEKRAPRGAEVRRLDLADLASVRAFAERIGTIDLLINNAGLVLLGPPGRTADGFEIHLGTNMLGHFALTGLLLDRVTGRVINLSSIVHKRARLEFDDLMSTRDYSGSRAYGRSKLATTVFGLELDRRLRAAGSPVISVLAHPGLTDTNLTPRANAHRGPTARRLIAAVSGLVTQPVARGALPQLHAATAPDVRGGQFFGPAGPGETRGRVTEVGASAHARDPEVGRRLWAAAAALTGVSYLPGA
jgi:NAD(P)-dependent dehydrogenase (short-subunit alcohol dehydrogenase family)